MTTGHGYVCSVSQHSQPTTGESSQVFVTPQLFDEIVGDEKGLIAIDTPRAEDILVQFRQFAVRSGNSIYAWSESEGITSLRGGDVSVPGSARIADALRYVNGSIHFGVYLFVGLAGILRFSPTRPQALAALRQIARAKAGGNARKVVLIDTKVALSDGLDELMSRYVDAPVAQRRIRLRDGRWVI